MALIPKKTKYRLAFRNKTKARHPKQFQESLPQFNQQSFIKNAWFDQFAIKTKNHSQVLLLGSEPRLLSSNLIPHFSLGSVSLGSGKAVVEEQTFSSFVKSFSNQKNIFLLPPCDTNRPLIGKTLPFDLTVSKLSALEDINIHQMVLSKHGFDQLLFGTSGICFLEKGTVTTKFIETIRLHIARKFKKKSRFWIRISTDTPVTARPAETRMGKGKGSISHWEAQISPGQIFLEFSGVSKPSLQSLFKQISDKSPIKLKLLSK